MASIAFYISGHGFGHASRQIEIINALGPHLSADTRIIIRTSAPRWLFDRTLTVPVTLLAGECDTGIVQIDSLRIDEAETVHRAREFYAAAQQRTLNETELLRTHEAKLVVADAPPLACAAADALGIPSVIISNFTWDWIYDRYARRFEAEAPDVVPVIARAYSTATGGWRLPMHGGFATVRPVTDLPFVARHARHAQDEVRDVLDLPAERPLALCSFGGYGLTAFDLASVDCLEHWTVVATGRVPPRHRSHGLVFVDESRMYESGLRYEDLVAAVDVVVTKPGYGIISECVANGTAMLYTSRGQFPEYDIMVAEMPRVLRCAYLDQASLLAGRWRAALDALLASLPPPEYPPTDGAEVAADRLSRLVV